MGFHGNNVIMSAELTCVVINHEGLSYKLATKIVSSTEALALVNRPSALLNACILQSIVS